jgi:membrane protein required for colicin V production
MEENRVSFSALDIVCIILVVFFAIRGAYRGLICEVMSFAALAVGLGGAILLTAQAVLHLEQYVGESMWNKVIAFLGIFLAGYLLVKIVEHMLVTIIERVALERFDQALGFFLGIIEGAALYAGFIVLLLLQPFVDSTGWLAESITAGIVIAVLPIIPELFERGAVHSNV